MNLLFQWSPLLAMLCFPLIAGLLVAGRTNLRRTTRMVALAAVIAVFVEFVAAFAVLQLVQHTLAATDGYAIGYSVVRVADISASLLALAAAVLLLYAAAQADDRGTLAIVTVAFMLASVVQFSQDYRLPLLGPLVRWLVPFGTGGELLAVVLLHLTAIAAVVCAFVAPARAPTTPAAANDTRL